MTMCELATAAVHKLAVKVLVINNNYLGMVRQWQELFYDNRLSGVDLEGNPDFVKLAEAYGVKGLRIRRPADIDRKLKEARDHDDGPVLVVAEVVKEDNVFPMIPAGAPITRHDDRAAEATSWRSPVAAPELAPAPLRASVHTLSLYVQQQARRAGARGAGLRAPRLQHREPRRQRRRPTATSRA